MLFLESLQKKQPKQTVHHPNPHPHPHPNPHPNPHPHPYPHPHPHLETIYWLQQHQLYQNPSRFFEMSWNLESTLFPLDLHQIGQTTLLKTSRIVCFQKAPIEQGQLFVIANFRPFLKATNEKQTSQLATPISGLRSTVVPHLKDQQWDEKDRPDSRMFNWFISPRVEKKLTTTTCPQTRLRLIGSMIVQVLLQFEKSTISTNVSVGCKCEDISVPKQKQLFFTNHKCKKNTLFSFFFDDWMIFEFLSVLFCWVQSSLGARISPQFSFLQFDQFENNQKTNKHRANRKLLVEIVFHRAEAMGGLASTLTGRFQSTLLEKWVSAVETVSQVKENNPCLAIQLCWILTRILSLFCCLLSPSFCFFVVFVLLKFCFVEVLFCWNFVLLNKTNTKKKKSKKVLGIFIQVPTNAWPHKSFAWSCVFFCSKFKVFASVFSLFLWRKNNQHLSCPTFFLLTNNKTHFCLQLVLFWLVFCFDLFFVSLKTKNQKQNIMQLFFLCVWSTLFFHILTSKHSFCFQLCFQLFLSAFVFTLFVVCFWKSVKQQKQTKLVISIKAKTMVLHLWGSGGTTQNHFMRLTIPSNKRPIFFSISTLFVMSMKNSNAFWNTTPLFWIPNFRFHHCYCMQFADWTCRQVELFPAVVFRITSIDPNNILSQTRQQQQTPQFHQPSSGQCPLAYNLHQTTSWIQVLWVVHWFLTHVCQPWERYAWYFICGEAVAQHALFCSCSSSSSLVVVCFEDLAWIKFVENKTCRIVWTLKQSSKHINCFFLLSSFLSIHANYSDKLMIWAELVQFFQTVLMNFFSNLASQQIFGT